MEKFEPLKEIKNISIGPADQDYISSEKLVLRQAMPAPILIFYVGIGIGENDSFLPETGKYLNDVQINIERNLENSGWKYLIIPRCNSEEIEIEVATVSSIPQDFEEFKANLLDKLKEI